MNADQKKKAEALHKLNKKFRLTINVLDSDVEFARNQWQQNPSNQFWSRTLIRCHCASVEGTLSLLKSVTCESAGYFDITLTKEDIEVATEQRTHKQTGLPTNAFLPMRDSVKKTFQVFAKAHATQVDVKYDVPGFMDFKNTFELRNNLMHPKKLFDLEVSDKALDAADRGSKWFRAALEKVLEECGKKLPFAQNRS